MFLPYELREEFLNGNLVVFVGAGFVKNYLNTMPTWDRLLRDVFETLRDDPDEIYGYCEKQYNSKRERVIPSSEYLKLAQQFELARERENQAHARQYANRKPIPSIHRQVQKRLMDIYETADAKQAVKGTRLSTVNALPLPLWITTNYDTFLEDTILNAPADAVLARPVRNADFGRMATRLLLKIHGCITHSDPEASIVITEDDYHNFLRRDRYLVNKLYTIFCERTVVFLGYSLTDPNIQFIYNDVLFDQKTSNENAPFNELRPAFFLSRTRIPRAQQDYFRHKKIRYLYPAAIEDFFAALTEAHEKAQRQRDDIVAHINNDIEQYRTLFSGSTTARIPETRTSKRKDFIRQSFDLIRLGTLIRRGVSPIPEFEPLELWKAVAGATKTIVEWCSEGIGDGSLDMLDVLLTNIELLARPNNGQTYKGLLAKTGQLLTKAVRIAGVHRHVRRWCNLIAEYDESFNDWKDYTTCLVWYIKATSMLPVMDIGLQRRIANGLYQQLRTCGRSLGDSWYTTEEVYERWQDFNPEFWPHLRARIKRNKALDEKDRAMLEHLKPGADPTLFLPRGES